MTIWIIYLIFLFVSVGLVYRLALNFFYRKYFGGKRRQYPNSSTAYQYESELTFRIFNKEQKFNHQELKN
jgi:hypothetical protein